jgi:hypothetical protein
MKSVLGMRPCRGILPLVPRTLPHQPEVAWLLYASLPHVLCAAEKVVMNCECCFVYGVKASLQCEPQNVLGGTEENSGNVRLTSTVADGDLNP